MVGCVCPSILAPPTEDQVRVHLMPARHDRNPGMVALHNDQALPRLAPPARPRDTGGRPGGGQPSSRSREPADGSRPASPRKRPRGCPSVSGSGSAESRAPPPPSPGGRIPPAGLVQALQQPAPDLIRGAALHGDRIDRHLRDLPPAHRQAPEPVLPGNRLPGLAPGVDPLPQRRVVKLARRLQQPLQAPPAAPRPRGNRRYTT